MKSAPTPIAITSVFDYIPSYSNSFVSVVTDQPAPCKKAFSFGCKQEEGNNPMNYATATVQAATTETQDQRKYLEKRLQEVYHDKRDNLEAHFGIIDDDAPNGPAELAERLKDGKYTLRTGDRYQYWHWTELIQWRHPDRKQDFEGFEAAKKDLQSLRQKSLDTIKIDDVKACLDAVKALEAWEPTVTQ